jgi:hypothetical protein
MPALALLTCLFAAFWVGCGKPSSNSAPPGSSEAEIAATLGELTQVLRKFSAEKQRVPKSMDELIAPGYLTQLPPAPPGKKFAITEKVEVILVKQ